METQFVTHEFKWASNWPTTSILMSFVRTWRRVTLALTIVSETEPNRRMDSTADRSSQNLRQPQDWPRYLTSSIHHHHRFTSKPAFKIILISYIKLIISQQCIWKCPLFFSWFLKDWARTQHSYLVKNHYPYDKNQSTYRYNSNWILSGKTPLQTMGSTQPRWPRTRCLWSP